MPPLTNLCVFCGSNPGALPVFATAASHVGTSLSERKIGLIYGGGSVGLMGVVADAVLHGGGNVIGVITESLAAHEVGHHGLSRLEVVTTMHERKARMTELADGFIMLPGGFGTYEEFMESATWAQLGIHQKPCGILNVDGFFDSLLTFLSHVVDMGFISRRQLDNIIVSDDADHLLDVMVERA